MEPIFAHAALRILEFISLVRIMLEIFNENINSNTDEFEFMAARLTVFQVWI